MSLSAIIIISISHNPTPNRAKTCKSESYACGEGLWLYHEYTRQMLEASWG